jgi:hypothetical protein
MIWQFLAGNEFVFAVFYGNHEIATIENVS